MLWLVEQRNAFNAAFSHSTPKASRVLYSQLFKPASFTDALFCGFSSVLTLDRTPSLPIPIPKKTTGMLNISMNQGAAGCNHLDNTHHNLVISGYSISSDLEGTGQSAVSRMSLFHVFFWFFFLHFSIPSLVYVQKIANLLEPFSKLIRFQSYRIQCDTPSNTEVFAAPRSTATARSARG